MFSKTTKKLIKKNITVDVSVVYSKQLNLSVRSALYVTKQS